MSAVHHISPFAMAICIMNAKVSGLTVGLNVWGMGIPALRRVLCETAGAARRFFFKKLKKYVR
jgi:hypothetical protein